MKKNGFISTALIYTFFILFLVLMVFIISSYSNNRYLLGEYKIRLEENLSELNSADINLYVCGREKNSNKCDYDKDASFYLASGSGYSYKASESYCETLDGNPTDDIHLLLDNNKLTIDAIERGSCFAYFEKNN